MKIYDTSLLSPTDLDPTERDYVYNGLDCAVTAEVLEVLLPQLDNQTSATYAFSRSLQGPVLEMRLRGVLVDKARKAEVIDEYHDKLEVLERNLERIVLEGVGMPHFNWRSNDHLKDLFYERLGIPAMRRQGKVTVNRDALEKMEAYTIARPIVAHLIHLRELGKKISVLKTEIDPDVRMRTSYNIAGTETGRFSSSFSEFGTGGNLQNVEDSLRSVFIADPGMKMGYFDAEQGESRVVGSILWNLFRDGRYLDACESGDLHTFVTRLCWTDLPWTGDIRKDREIAERVYYRHYTYRKLCKSIGHGTNYKGGAYTLHVLYKVAVSAIEDFQRRYIPAFGFQAWWDQIETQLRQHGQMTTLTGRRRHFFGRRNDDSTLREAIAYDPQGSLADIVNRGMLSVWQAGDCQLLMQNHDAIVVQYPEDREDQIVPLVISQLRSPIELQHDRTLNIPYGAKTGWNFGEWSKDNPDGLKEYKPSDKRKRAAKVSILDRKFR